MNKRTVALTDQQYIDIITTIKNGFTYNDITHTPNERIATDLTLEANLGIRISDILSLRFMDIVKDGIRKEGGFAKPVFMRVCSSHF